MALEITSREQEGISILQLKGRLTFGQEDTLLNNELRDMVGTDRVVIDLGDVDKIDSAGLGTLLYAGAELRRAGGGLALANLHPAHMEMLSIAGLDTVFDVFGTQQDAINSFFPYRQVPHYDLRELVTSIRQARGLQTLKRAS